MSDTNEVSDLSLERFVLGELDAPTRNRIAEELRSNAALQARLDAIHQSDVALRAAYPTEVVAKAIRRRAQDASSQARPWAVWLPWAMVACVSVVIAVPILRQAPQNSHDRLKGDATFAIERLVPNSPPAALLSGDHGKAGDVLQMAVHAPVPPYLVIVSIDGSGEVTQLFPTAGVSEAAPTANLHDAYLPVTYTLDAAPAFERIFLVGSDAPFNTDSVMAAARTLATSDNARQASLSLNTTLSQTAILILKD